MRCWQVNRIHENSIYEEMLGINVEAETAEEAKEILEGVGWEVVEIDEEFERIKVK